MVILAKGSDDRPAPGKSGRMQRKPPSESSSGWKLLEVRAEPVQKDDRRPLAFDLELDLAAATRALMSAPRTNSFSSTPIPEISIRTTSPAYEIFRRLEADADAGRRARWRSRRRASA